MNAQLPARRRLKRRGVPLTVEVGRTIVGAIAAGNFPSIACKLAGVSTDTVETWLSRGDRGEQPYKDFTAAYRQAEIQCESALVEQWKSAAPDDWRAAKELLARRFPERWAPAAMDAPVGMQAFSINIHLNGSDEDESLEARDATPAIDVSPEQPPGCTSRVRDKDPDSTLN